MEITQQVIEREEFIDNKKIIKAAAKVLESKFDTLNTMESEMTDLMPDLKEAAEAEEPEIDCEFIENQILKPRSEAAEKIFNLHCKEQALQDLIMGLREKQDWSVQDGCRSIRQLAMKQFKTMYKRKRLMAYHMQQIQQ